MPRDLINFIVKNLRWGFSVPLTSFLNYYKSHISFKILSQLKLHLSRSAFAYIEKILLQEE